MKFKTVCFLLAIWGQSADAAVYKCKATIGIAESGFHLVDTSNNLQYIWLFIAYPNAQPWCGSARDSRNLTCELRATVSGFRKTYASAQIEIGGRTLGLYTPECGDNLLCKIECSLEQTAID